MSIVLRNPTLEEVLKLLLYSDQSHTYLAKDDAVRRMTPTNIFLRIPTCLCEWANVCKVNMRTPLPPQNNNRLAGSEVLQVFP